MFPFPGCPPSYFLDWAKYSQKAQDTSILYVDMNHRNDRNTIYSPYVTFYSIGVRLNGQVFTQWKKGNWNDFSYWLTK